MTTIQLNDKLPLCSDINSHPSVRLLSRHPVWLDKPAPDATAASEWIDAWFNTTVDNQSHITDPTICPPGFNLPRCLVHTNRCRTGQGRCAANRVRWHQASDTSCICGNPQQTMDHIVNQRPISNDFLVICAIVTLSLRHAVFMIFDFKKCCDPEIHVRGHSRSLKVVPFNRLCMVSY